MNPNQHGNEPSSSHHIEAHRVSQNEAFIEEHSSISELSTPGGSYESSQGSVLSIDDFERLGSYENLRALYLSRGETFANENELLRRISKDWRYALAQKNEPGPKEISQDRKNVDVIEVDGVRYSLVGVAHDFASAMDQKSVKLVQDALDDASVALCEHGLRIYFRKKGMLQIDEHAANPFWSDVKNGLIAGVLAPLVYPAFFGFLAYRLLSPTAAKRMNEEINSSSAEEQVPTDYPTYVEMHFVNKKRLPSDGSNLMIRCAYQAEFMKAYRAGESKALLCGCAHNRYVAYFLKHGVEDARIVSMAKRHAKLAEDHPVAYQALAFGTIAKSIGVLAGATLIGASPYFMLASLLW